MSILATAMVVIGSCGCAILLRWARFPVLASPMLGGIVAGLLLGPGILGEAFPRPHEALFEGGASQRAAREAVVRRHGADLAAARHFRIDDAQMQRMKREQAAELAPHEQAIAQAQWDHQQPLRIVAAVLIGILFLCAARLQIRSTIEGPSAISVLSIGAWAAVLPGAIASVIAMRWWTERPAAAAMAAAALAIGPWALAASDREAADFAEVGGAAMIERAGRFASVMAIAVAAWALVHDLGPPGIAWLLPLMMLPAAWLLARARSRSPQPPPGQSTRGPSPLVHLVLIPGIAGLAALKVHVIDDFAVWPMLVILLLSDDGRWLGAVIGALLPGGRKGLRTMRLVMGSMAAGRTQLGVAALAAQTGLIPPKLILPLLLGALLIELSAPARRGMTERLLQMEDL